MAVKLFKPVTSSMRGLTSISRSGLWKGRPKKSLVSGRSGVGGARNNLGRMTVRARGGGHKRLLRNVSFRYHDIIGSSFTVDRVEYDPGRSAFICLLRNDNEIRYSIAASDVKIGSTVSCGSDAKIEPGNMLPLGSIPSGTQVCSIELMSGAGGKLSRSAGCYSTIIAKDLGSVWVRTSSGVVRVLKSSCYATVGSVSNSDRKNISYGKAGRNRWRGFRPNVRGVAMNPVDHPHGGGQGKTGGGRHPVSPWGFHTKGAKTVRRPRGHNKIIKQKGGV